MFDTGLDQAHGLKQIFLPFRQSRIEIVRVGSGDSFNQVMENVGHALVARGFELTWEDPQGMLPADLPRNIDDDGTPIVVSVRRDDPVSHTAGMGLWESVDSMM